MAVKKTGERWQVDCWPQGRRGKRVRKTFDTQREAKDFERWVMHDKGEAWQAQQADNRRLSELVQLWYTQHGHGLKDGTRRHRALLSLAKALNDPPAQRLTAAAWMDYRAKRAGAGISKKTLNNHHTYLNAVYNELRRTDQIRYDNPLAKVRKYKIEERELSYLTEPQIIELLASCDSDTANQSLGLITRVCLATGARWGEAEGLKAHHLSLNKITFTGTKSGKNRAVPVAAELFSQVKSYLANAGRFQSSEMAFRRAVARCSFTLPRGQSSHVLRHSFASHFMMNGGDILTLQRILGHSTITMTMKYAHLAPDHLSAAVSYNPLRRHFVDNTED